MLGMAVVAVAAVAGGAGSLAPAEVTVKQQADVYWAIQQFGNSLVKYCWRRSYGRGAGSPLGCAAGLVEDAALCYAPCRSGYSGAAFLCWEDCPAGFRDTGVDCLKPPAYGRGAGYVIWDHGECVRENPQGCEKWGLLWYPMCHEGFHPVGCCICSPDCPVGFTDIGVSCQRPTYDRGVGRPITTCDPPLEEDGALCYTPCNDAFTGVGPVCWSQCGGTLSYSCAAGCATDAATCGESIFAMIESVFKMALDIIEAAFSDGAEAVAKAALKGAIESAVEFGIRAAAHEVEVAVAGQHLQAAAQQAHDKLLDRWSSDLLSILQSQWPNDPTMPATILDSAAWHVAYTAVSSNQYNLLDFVETVLPFNVGGVIKAFDKPLCAIDVPPQRCSEVPSVCNNDGQCNGNWSCTCAPGWDGPTCNVSTGESTREPDFNLDKVQANVESSTSRRSASKPAPLGAGAIIAVTVIMAALVAIVALLAYRRALQERPQLHRRPQEDSLIEKLMTPDE